MKLDDEIRDWLRGYVDKDVLDGLTNMISYAAWKQVKIGIAVGMVLGFMFTMILLKYLG